MKSITLSRLNLKKYINLWVVDANRTFDFSTPMYSPVPQLQYRLITTLFSNSIEAIRGFNAFTLALLAAIFIAISKQLNSTVTSTITLLILFVTDFLFFNYNRLAHLETQVILWCGLSVFFQNKLFISHSTLQRAGWGFCCRQLLFGFIVNQGAFKAQFLDWPLGLHLLRQW